ncbi:hypothetical protein MBLNU230_g2668t1 [Neophaeotheca triangularis]
MADASEQQPQPHASHPAQPDEAAEEIPGLVPSHGITLRLPPTAQQTDVRPPAVRQTSLPTYHSPIRHHRRAPSRTKGVKETLNARSNYGSSEDDGASVRRINQYVIKQEIGRGSFGAVHLATDQQGNEFAVKEFSKSRLRRRAQSNLLRRPNAAARRPGGHLAAGLGFNSPLHRSASPSKGDLSDPRESLALIREEIAIMKKLSHNNLVSLIEVLDDPQEDSLYMVLEMCKKGVVMKVGIEHERAEPYEEEACRCWFRDMILGIEYLHAQGIIHRDIKPDNCLITGDDVLKIVDFGVSEMFEKESDMATAKSAGSPAFMPPELCVAKHGHVSGKAADCWSMGVTLYCLKYGRIPFEKTGMLEMYEAIRNDDVPFETETNGDFEDLIRRILDKDPATRITIDGMREHPWVTKRGQDPLLSSAENCADIIEPPSQDEMDNAITGNMAHILVVMKAVKRFKKLLTSKRPQLMEAHFGRDRRIVNPPDDLRDLKPNHQVRQSRSTDADDRRPIDRVLVTEGVHRDYPLSDNLEKEPPGLNALATLSSRPADDSDSDEKQRGPSLAEDGLQMKQMPGESDARFMQRIETMKHKPFPSAPSPSDTDDVQEQAAAIVRRREAYAKGHAHDILSDTLFLDIGPDPGHAGPEPDSTDTPIISESPSAVDENVYEQAYQEEMRRILEERGRSATLYINRRVEHREDIKRHANVVINKSRDFRDRGVAFGKAGGEKAGRAKDKIGDLVRRAREKAGRDVDADEAEMEQGEISGKKEEGAGIEATDAARHGESQGEKEDVAAKAAMDAVEQEGEVEGRKSTQVLKGEKSAKLMEKLPGRPKMPGGWLNESVK